MSGRFSVDLLHPGHVADTWQDWFIGPQGRRRLIIAAGFSAGVLLLVVIALILPTRLRLSQDVGAIPKLRADLATRDGDLTVLRQDLQALSVEAKRQVRWAEVLNAFRQQIPQTLKLQKVEAGGGAAAATGPPGQGQPQGGPAGAGELRIEALTPLRPGPPPLLEIAQFMGGLLKDPSISKRYQLKSWEIKLPGGGGAAAGEGAQLQIVIMLAEKPR
ncbi:MAG: hypothetical protein Q7W02_11370 [Candidatus Rokubacteria bacterium]|nr:hypothetical protein [Candidatus Rokubacteria bacterium]